MNCKRCYRELKNPKSVQNGYGPVCWSKMLAAHPVVVGNTNPDPNNEISKSIVKLFDQLKENRTRAEKEPDKCPDDNGDENKATTWTDMYGIIHILEEN